jgi:hypothetical protein
VVVRVLMSDIESLQNFFGCMMIDKMDIKLSQIVSETMNANVSVEVNPTKFAECFENAMSRLENLTPHQMEIYKKCLKHDRVHLKGPGGSGKTFLAIHMICENLRYESPKPVVFISKSEALCKQITKLLYMKGIRREKLTDHLFFKFIQENGGSGGGGGDQFFCTGIKCCSFVNNKISLKEPENPPNMTRIGSYSIVVVDEAHHLFELEVDDVFGVFGTQSLLEYITDDFSYLHKLLLLSDMSQSWLSELDNALGTEPISLQENVRCSENIMTGSKCYAVDHAEVKSHHKLRGFPIKTFLYSSGLMNSEDERIEKLNSALEYITKSFRGLDLTGRLAILVPNKTSYDRHMGLVSEALSIHGLKPITAMKNTEILGKTANKVVYDTVDNFSGLESLIVIGLEFDDPNIGNEGRSVCYRLITRAQMLLILVGSVVEGGYFEWLQYLEYDPDVLEPLQVDESAPNNLVDMGRKKAPETTIKALDEEKQLRHPLLSLGASEEFAEKPLDNLGTAGDEESVARLQDDEFTSIKPMEAKLMHATKSSIIDTSSNSLISSNNCAFMPLLMVSFIDFF